MKRAYRVSIYHHYTYFSDWRGTWICYGLRTSSLQAVRRFLDTTARMYYFLDDNPRKWYTPHAAYLLEVQAQ